MSEFLIGGTVLQLDRGWVQTETNRTIEFRKGYSLESSLSDIDPNGDEQVGNYCIIQYMKSVKMWTISKDSLRGFPVYHSDSVITNLDLGNTELHPDHCPYMYNGHVSLLGPYAQYKLPKKGNLLLDEIVDRVEFELLDYIEKFIKYNDNEIICNSTYGYDCTTLKAILDFNNIPHIYTDFRPARKKLPLLSEEEELFIDILNTQWGYWQVDIANEPQTILTGFCGDEFLMRGPLYVYYYLKQYKIDISKEVLLSQSYQRQFIEEHYIKINKFAECTENPTNMQLANALLTDYQMWGIDDTTTIIPYKNIKILELSFRLKPEDALKQGLHAIIQHRIIEKCNPALLATISPNKNER